MNKNEKVSVTIYVILSLVVISILTVMVMRKCKKKESYKKCVCSQADGGRGRVCQDVKQVWDSYVDGKTEYQDMSCKRSWSKTSPGDMNFPQSKGCGEREDYSYNNNQPDRKGWLPLSDSLTSY